MSKDNDGLCATAEAFVYVAMTRPMVFFRAFHAAIAAEMLLAIAYVWWYALSGRRRRPLHIAAASLIGEGMLISANGGDFPLGGLQERLGDSVPLFELVVSPRAANRAAPTLGAITSRQFLQTVHSRSGGEESWTLDLRHANKIEASL